MTCTSRCKTSMTANTETGRKLKRAAASEMLSAARLMWRKFRGYGSSGWCVNVTSCISYTKAFFELRSGVLSSSEIFEMHDALVYNVHIFFIIKPRVV